MGPPYGRQELDVVEHTHMYAYMQLFEISNSSLATMA